MSITETVGDFAMLVRGFGAGPLIRHLQQIRLEQADTPCEDLDVELPVHRLGGDEFRELSLQSACCSKHSCGLRLTRRALAATTYGHVVDQQSREKTRSDRSWGQFGCRVDEPGTRHISGEELGHIWQVRLQGISKQTMKTCACQ